MRSWQYVYSIDHPTLKRHLYRWALHATGTTRLDVPDVDYTRSVEANLAEGRVPSLVDVVIPLRLVNALLVTGAVVMIFAVALLILRNGWMALVVALPFVLDRRVAYGVVAYLGTDALLAFFLALSLLVLVILERKNLATRPFGLVALGIAAGLATGAKFNGALVAVAFCIYVFLSCRGVARIWKPMVVGLVAFLLFVALNPVVRLDGVGGFVRVVGEMLARRRELWLRQQARWGLPRWVLVARFFPYAAFLYTFAAAWPRALKTPGVKALVVWAGVITVGTLASVHTTFARYHLPVLLATYSAGGVFAMHLLREALKRARRPGPTAWSTVARWVKAVGAALVAALIILTAVVALEVWGPSRFKISMPAKARVEVFFRQAGAAAGVCEPFDAKSLRDLTGPDAAAGGVVELIDEPLLTADLQRTVATAAILVGLLVLYRIGLRLLGNRWLAAAVVVVAIVSHATLGRWPAPPVSEALLFLFAAMTILVWLAAFERSRGPGGWAIVGLALTVALSVAAGPGGIFVAAGVVALLVLDSRRGGGLLGAVVVTGAAVCLFSALERLLWMLGARAQYDFVYTVSHGLFTWRHWPTHPGAALVMLVGNAFPYMGLAALAVAGVWASRSEKVWRVALWSGLVIVGYAVTMPDHFTSGGVTGDLVGTTSSLVSLALALGVSIPGLVILRRVRQERSIETA